MDSTPDREIILIADRVLIAPDSTDDRKTRTGLYLPQGLAEKEQVHSGYVTKVGPGYILPHTETSSELPWEKSRNEPQFVPLQVKEGDYAIFLRKEALEVEYENKKYLIIHQAGILAVIREKIPDLGSL